MKILFFAGMFFFSLLLRAAAPEEIFFVKSVGVWKHSSITCIGEKAKDSELEPGKELLIRVDASSVTYTMMHADGCKLVTKMDIKEIIPLTYDQERKVVEAEVLVGALVSHSENCPNQVNGEDEGGLLNIKIERTVGTDGRGKNVLKIESKTGDGTCPNTKHSIETAEFYGPLNQAAAHGPSVSGNRIAPASDTEDTAGGRH